MEEKKKLYQKWWFWVCIVLIVALVVGAILVSVAKKTPTSTTYTSSGFFNVEPTKENIVIEKLAVINKNNLVISIKNNNSSKVVIDNISAILKDENGNFIKKANCMDTNIPLNAGQNTVSYVWEYDFDFSNYSNVEFTFEINNNTSGMFPANLYICDNFEITANDTGEQIAVTVKNNNKEKAAVTLNALYYKDDKIVGFSGLNITDDIDSGSQGYINIPYPYNEDGDTISFDNYKIYFVKGKIK